MARDTEHGRAVAAQLTRRQGTLDEAIDAAVFALAAAGLSKGIQRQARAACEDYFYGRLDLTPSYELGGREEIETTLELMPEAMYHALEDVVGLVVDGEYEDLRAASGNRLSVEDLRRRVEDDCPESLVLPPRETYQVEAIAKSDDPDLPGWAYFLDLWTENGPARLHIEGELEESGEVRPGDQAEGHPALKRRPLCALCRRVQHLDRLAAPTYEAWLGVRAKSRLTRGAATNAESPPVSGLSAIRRSGGYRGKGTFR